ncbi:LOW QUALITY PROTEIN: uncharacterized protein [Amphiura filiformis]|uniref:LOW QUALITY PROTEIN: uncharacterized protein n=1 Tax=Amphiura filiformis TaxID=82378 RepID=UPI003B218A5B
MLQSNLMTMWCEFKESIYTGIRANFTMEYKLRIDHETDGVWQECTQHDLPQYSKDSKSKTCFVDDEGEVGEDIYVRVRQSNALGKSPYREITYHMFQNLKPSQVENFRVTTKTSTSMKMSWEVPNDWIPEGHDPSTYYRLQYLIRYANNLTNPANVSTNVTVDFATEYELTGLSPDTSYKLAILCYAINSQKSEWRNLTEYTEQDAPGDTVRNLISNSETLPESAFLRDVSLTWEDVPEESQHGEIIGYSVYYMSEGAVAVPRHIKMAFKLRKLERFDKYTVYVNAHTALGGGPNATVTIEDETKPPSSLEDEEIEVTLAHKTNSTLKLRWDEATNPSGVIAAYGFQWKHNDGEWSDIVTRESGAQNIYEYEIKNLKLFTEYDVRMRFSNSDGTSGWTKYGPWRTAGGVPSKPLFHDPKRLSASETELYWESPATTYDETVTYQVRYRPLPEIGKPVIAWQHASQTQNLDVRVRVNCSMVNNKQSTFAFEVVAITSGGKSTAVERQLDMCDNPAGSQIVLLAVFLAVFSLGALIIIFYCWCKHSDITKPAPEPYFIDAVLSPTESTKFQWREGKNSPKHEKERFDTLRSATSHTELLSPVIERMSSKDSSTASTDQGIHDMDVDSVDLKNGGPTSNSARRCNRYSSGMGQSILSDCGTLGCARSTSNPGMEVLSEDYEDAVFEEIPQDIDDGSMPCLSHTYARSSFNPSPPLSPNEDGIGSSSSLLSNGSAGLQSLPPYSQMAYNQHQRLSSSGSDSSGVNYHMMGSQGLAPISKESNDVGSLTYSKLSQIPASPSPPPDVVVDLDHPATASDEDAPEYHQMGLRDPEQGKIDNPSDSQVVAQNNNKSPSHFNNIPTVDVGSLVQPQKEFIVATALMPNHPQQKPEALKKPGKTCPEVKPNQNEAAKIQGDDHSYSVIGANTVCENQPQNTPNPPSSVPPKRCNADSPYVPNGCPNGFSIPNGMPATKPVPMSCSNGYIPHNSPPTQGGFLSSQPQSTNQAHSMPNGISEGYAPATPHAMSAIVQGKPLTNDGYVPNTTVV